MKIAIIGYGSQGRAAYEYYRKGNEITVCDQNELLELPSDVQKKLGPNHLKDLDQFDLIVRSPIVHPREIVEANTYAILGKVTTVTNEFFRVCPTKNIIGVTGTKGKGTTSTLIAKMLEAAGHTVHLGGNIGIPPLDMLKNNIKPEDWVVLELANFQLIDLQYSPHIAVVLMVVAEHLNWHTDMEEYREAKSQLFVHQLTTDIAVYYADNKFSEWVADASPGQKIPFFAPPGAIVENGAISIDGQALCLTDELKLLGEHNWQNACAAVTAVWQVTQDIAALRSVLTSFSGLEHRIELVREVNGVRYYNDSFATGLHATQAAIDAIPGKKVMILGGFERNLDIDHFGVFVKEREDTFRNLLLIGESAERLAGVLQKAGFTNYTLNTSAQTMPDIVSAATSLAKDGDAVVLSPGFASFDMFKNFEERGLQYKTAVNDL